MTVTVTSDVIYRGRRVALRDLIQHARLLQPRLPSRLGLASVSASPMANARRANFRVDGSPSWYTVAGIGQRNLLGVANLRINTTANALFSCRWWGGGQGGDHCFLLFMVLNVARLKALLLFHFR